MHHAYIFMYKTHLNTLSVSAVLNEKSCFNKKYGYPIMATLHAPAFELPEILNTKTNLADARIGAQVIECSDDFFAEAKRMLQFEAPILLKINLMIMANGWTVGRPAVSVMQAMTGVL